MSPTSSILAPTDTNIDRAVEVLRRGGLVGLPTETVYGLAAKATDPAAVRRIFAAKGRPPSNPLIVHVADFEAAADVLAAPLDRAVDRQLRAAASLWPGPLTVVCPRGRSVPDEVTAGRDTVALRIPDHPVALRLLRRCSFPLAAPSANRSNYISPTRAEHVVEGLGEHVALVLDGGPCRCGVESTIVSLDPEGPRLLRPGAVPREQLRELFGPSLRDDHSIDHRSMGHPAGSAGAEPLAPGMMRVHYAPRTPLVFADEQHSSGKIEKQSVGRIAFAPLSPDEAARCAEVEVLSETGDLDEVARHLFDALRRLDRKNLDLLVTDTCSESGIGRAIMDRLRRAAARRP